MVAAFEQSLSSMTTRLQQLSSSSDLKDCELDRLRKTIETLKQQGGTLVGAAKNHTVSANNMKSTDASNKHYHTISGSHQLRTSLIRRHTFNNSLLTASLSTANSATNIASYYHNTSGT